MNYSQTRSDVVYGMQALERRALDVVERHLNERLTDYERMYFLDLPASYEGDDFPVELRHKRQYFKATLFVPWSFLDKTDEELAKMTWPEPERCT